MDSENTKIKYIDKDGNVQEIVIGKLSDEKLNYESQYKIVFAKFKKYPDGTIVTDGIGNLQENIKEYDEAIRRLTGELIYIKEYIKYYTSVEIYEISKTEYWVQCFLKNGNIDLFNYKLLIFQV